MKRPLDRSLLPLPLLVLGTTLAGCAGRMTVRDQAAADLREGSYGTYHILEQPVGREPSLDEVVRAGLTGALDGRGYRSAAYETADLIVTYKILLDQSVGFSPVGSNARSVVTSGQPRALWAGQPPGEAVLSADLRDDGRRKILLVMLQDARTHRVVWLGWSHTETTLFALRDHAVEAIAGIMERLPPRS